MARNDRIGTNTKGAGVPSRLLGVGLVIASALVPIPALLAAADRSAAVANAAPLVGGERRSMEGLRREAATSLAAGHAARAAADARAVLERHPLDRTALRLLSEGERRTGHDDLADDLTLAASFVSWRDPAAESQMFSLALATGDLADAARRADAINRAFGYHAAGFRALNLLMSRPGGVAAVAARLAAGSPWRGDYFRNPRQGLAAAPQHAVPLLRALAGTGAPASAAETDQALAAMVAHGLAPEAWAYWRQAHGGAGGAVIDDPDLRAVQVLQPDQAGSPFGWSMPADTLVRLSDHRDAAGHPALRVEVREDRSAFFVSRRIVVAPGRYRLSYQAAGAADQLERLHLEMQCLNGLAIRLTPVDGSDATTSVADIPVGCTAPRVGFTVEPGASADLSIRRVSITKL